MNLMPIVFRCLILFSLLLRVFTADAMTLSMAMSETGMHHATTLQVVSANTPCHETGHYDASAPSGKSCCDHEQHAKCFDCCLGALMVSSHGVLPSLPRPPFLPAADVAYVGTDLTQLTKPPIF